MAVASKAQWLKTAAGQKYGEAGYSTYLKNMASIGQTPSGGGSSPAPAAPAPRPTSSGNRGGVEATYSGLGHGGPHTATSIAGSAGTHKDKRGNEYKTMQFLVDDPWQNGAKLTVTGIENTGGGWHLTPPAGIDREKWSEMPHQLTYQSGGEGQSTPAPGPSGGGGGGGGSSGGGGGALPTPAFQIAPAAESPVYDEADIAARENDVRVRGQEFINQLFDEEVLDFHAMNLAALIDPGDEFLALFGAAEPVEAPALPEVYPGDLSPYFQTMLEQVSIPGLPQGLGPIGPMAGGAQIIGPGPYDDMLNIPGVTV